MKKLSAAAILGVALTVSACDRQTNDQDQLDVVTANPSAKQAATASGPISVEKTALEVRDRNPWGPHLTDAGGRTLYMFSRDEQGASKCQGRCLQDWPPLLQKGVLVAGAGVDQARIGTLVREGGLRQVTYSGRPLYYYVAAQSSNPGSVAGIRSYDGVWHLISPTGGPVGTTRSP